MMSKVKYDSENRSLLAQRVIDRMKGEVELYQFVYDTLTNTYEKDEQEFYREWEWLFEGEEDENIG